MDRVYALFLELTQIPHCSYRTEALKNYLIDFAKRYHYHVIVDEAGNILASKENPTIALQAHYDMVCVGRAPTITTFEKEGWLYAKESSLGADNGIGVAMMLALMEEEVVAEFLFSNDEEVGLVGANALSFSLQSPFMLNLDSEEEGTLYIGCAGGVDLFAKKSYVQMASKLPCYEVIVSGFPGGHSGVEIDKGITNAIKYFATYLKDKEVQLVSLEGGERINSIPVSVKAVVASKEPLIAKEHISIKPCDGACMVVRESGEIVDMLNSFEDGVLAFDTKLGIPFSSINLAKISLKEGICNIAISARAMENQALERIEARYCHFFESFGYDVKSEGKYPAWQPKESIFSKKVCDLMHQELGSCALKAIHAGLECAILSQKYPSIEIVSLGPTILSPHSTHEGVEIASIERVFGLVQKIVAAF